MEEALFVPRYSLSAGTFCPPCNPVSFNAIEAPAKFHPDIECILLSTLSIRGKLFLRKYRFIICKKYFDFLFHQGEIFLFPCN